MSLPLLNVLEWQPRVFGLVAGRARGAVADLDAIRLELIRAVAAVLACLHSWTGAAATRAQRSVDERVVVLGLGVHQLSELAAQLNQADNELADQLGRVRSATDELDATTGVLPAIGAAVSPLGWLWWREQRANAVQRELQELVVLDRRWGGVFAESERLARAVRREHDVGGLRGDLVGPDGSDRGSRSALPAARTDPASVADWWAVLPAGQRASLPVGSSAARVGSLDGLPASVRDRANRTALRRRLLGFDPRVASPADRAAHAVDLQIASELRRLATTISGIPVLLLLDEPRAFGGTGRAAIAVGDPDQATNVAFVLAGLNNRIVGSMPADDDHAVALLRAAEAAGPAGVSVGLGRGGAGRGAGTTAVISWQGYQTPTLASVAWADRAVRGSTLLARDVNGLVVARGSNDPHLTLVGHSYGSTTAALATAQVPGEIDELVLVGSPGATVGTADDLAVQPSHVWVGAASSDPVTWVGWVGWFGPDPAGAGFAAQRFPADVTSPGPGFFDGHGHYLDGDGQSLPNVGRIVAGDLSSVPIVPGR